jgi:hypothetical protein
MTDRFLVVFFTVLALTLFCASGAALISLYGPSPLPPHVDRLFSAFVELFVAGVGAIFGLLGGRAIPSS